MTCQFQNVLKNVIRTYQFLKTDVKQMFSNILQYTLPGPKLQLPEVQWTIRRGQLGQLSGLLQSVSRSGIADATYKKMPFRIARSRGSSGKTDVDLYQMRRLFQAKNQIQETQMCAYR